MADFVYFRDGETYSAAQMSVYTDMVLTDGGGGHLLASVGHFAPRADTGSRSVVVASGTAYLALVGGGHRPLASAGGSVEVPASTGTPRRDLVVLRTDGTQVLYELIRGSGSKAPDRPAEALAVAWVDITATGQFSIRDVRFSGAYKDQFLSPAPGVVGVDWGGVLPDISLFRRGAQCVDIGTGQRWTAHDESWHTPDFGPWKEVSLVRSFTDSKAGTITPTGELYIRESSDSWQISGRVGIVYSKDEAGIAWGDYHVIGYAPESITRPIANAYAAAGQTITVNGPVCRIALRKDLSIEAATVGHVRNLYINTSLAKDPYNYDLMEVS
ncbi:hypothetical protein [Streptomyces cacaoi]|uniref:Uncharacterized protein n=1 Tax=Streptomyces cacaoi TaxID=1898 RepID=A0A4Y3QYW6_STRCI|nr:hypothetical protein [Streptomyces cacaoi]GEB50451.1 hypothetical protein SCA03_30020 [Streptomyces cacaoi]